MQLTPPGSECSIIFGTGVTSAAPGSIEGLQLTVSDIDAARDELVGRGVDVSEVFHDAGGVFHHAGTEARVAGPAPDHADYGSFASFSDPDGNGWLLQEINDAPARTGERRDDALRPRGRSGRGASARGGRARRARGAYRSGDPDWPDWYAEYMVREQAGEELPT